MNLFIKLSSNKNLIISKTRHQFGQAVEETKSFCKQLLKSQADSKTNSNKNNETNRSAACNDK